jgi:hypothetical protein
MQRCDRRSTSTYPREQLAQTVAECSTLPQPSDFNLLAYAAQSFSYLRQFTPRFLEVMRFRSDQESSPLLEAVAFMRQFNSERRRRLVDAPIGFIPWRWRKHMVSQGQVINRALYEFCLSECPVESVNNGQIWAECSREHTSFRHYWISDDECPAARRISLSRPPHLADVERFLTWMKQMLDKRVSEFDRQRPELEDEVEIVDGELYRAIVNDARRHAQSLSYPIPQSG